MRHVKYNPQKIKYPSDWHTLADEALKKVETKLPSEKSKELNKYQAIWGDPELKKELQRLTNGKCWYTEAPQYGTDTDIDHFRPKNAVKGANKPGTNEKHPGYWWRAFDPSNFRLSCIVANRRRKDIETGNTGGKADEFPLWKEENRAWHSTDDCNHEQPLLIDPCKATEVALITFAENGEAAARYSESDNGRLFKMADTSIKLYHINHSDFVRARIAIRDKLMEWVEDAKKYYKKLGVDDADNDHAYERAITQLIEACDEGAPFSGFANAILEPHKLDEGLKGVFR